LKKKEMGGGDVECMEKSKLYTEFWCRKLRERDYLEDAGVEGRIIVKWIFRMLNVGKWAGLIWFRIGTDGGQL